LSGWYWWPASAPSVLAWAGSGYIGGISVKQKCTGMVKKSWKKIRAWTRLISTGYKFLHSNSTQSSRKQTKNANHSRNSTKFKFRLEIKYYIGVLFTGRFRHFCLFSCESNSELKF
jgi:hypothetical protein